MFISFEGTEGVGKSTLITGLAAELNARLTQSVLVTREPGGTPLAEQIRQLLLTPHDADHTETLMPDTELLLLYAARAQHISHVIEPALKSGRMVLCDRFTDATLAYQCYGRGLNPNLIESMNHQFVKVMPSLTFWLDAPVEIGMQRAKNRGQLDRFEQEQLEFFERVREGYRQLHQHNPQRMIRLDAMLSSQQILEMALKTIIQLVNTSK